MNAYHPYPRNTKFLDNAVSDMMAEFISRMRIRGHWTTLLTSGQEVPIYEGGDQLKIDQNIVYNCILIYFTLSIMYNISRR